LVWGSTMQIARMFYSIPALDANVIRYMELEHQNSLLIFMVFWILSCVIYCDSPFLAMALNQAVICHLEGCVQEKFVLKLWTHCQYGDSSVDIALGYRLDNWGYKVQSPAGAGNFSLHHHVQNGSGAHPGSYPVGTRGSFPGDKATRPWSWSLTSIKCRGRMRGTIPPLPQYAFMVWCSVKKSTGTTLPLPLIHLL
jgi:hypothetical protein